MATKEGDNVRVTVSGTYDQFEGGYDMLFTPAGGMIVHSSYKYTGEDFKAREIGLRFSVPLECDRLQ